METAMKTRRRAAVGMKPRLAAVFRLLPALFLLSVFFASCRTAPPPAHLRDDATSIPLEPGGFAYILIDVVNARPILEHMTFMGMDTTDRNFRLILDSTSTALAAVYEVPGAGPGGTRFRLAAYGQFPSGRARMSMRFSRHWRGQRSPSAGDRYWHSRNGAMSIAISRNEALIATSLDSISVDPFFSGPGTPIPEGFSEFSSGAIISCWIENPSEFIGQRMREMNLPLEIPAEEFFISVFPAVVEGLPDEPRYSAILRIQVANAATATGLSFALSMARLFFVPPPPGEGDSMAAVMMSILFSNPAVAEGRYLSVRTDPMSAEEIAVIFSQFM